MASNIDQFLNALVDLGGKAGNVTLKKRLGITDEEYTAIKNDAVKAGFVVKGRGKGGSVQVVGNVNADPGDETRNFDVV